MIQVVLASGRTPYVYQSSEEERQACNIDDKRLGELSRLDPTSEEAGDQPGSCLIHLWPEDLKRGPEHRTPITDRHVILMRNVDYYLDFTKIAIGVPIMLYTLDIDKPSHRDSTCHWRFNQENELLYTAHYTCSRTGMTKTKSFKHKLWDWKHGTTVAIGDYTFKVTVRKPAKSGDGKKSRYKFVLLDPVHREEPTLEDLALRAFGVNPHHRHSPQYEGFWEAWSKSLVLRALSSCWPYDEDLQETPLTIDGDLPSDFLQQVVKATRRKLGFTPKKMVDGVAKPLKRVQPVMRGNRNNYCIMHVELVGRPPPARLTQAEKVESQNSAKAVEADDSLMTLVTVLGSYDYYELNHHDFVEMTTRKKLALSDCRVQFNQQVHAQRATICEMIQDLYDVQIEDMVYLTLYDRGNNGCCPYDSPNTLTPLMRPLVEVPVAPVLSMDNEIAATNARLLDISAPPDSTPSLALRDIIHEYVKLTCQHHTAITGAEYLKPVPLEEVLLRQDTEAKRKSVRDSILADVRPRPGHVFTKKENDGGEAGEIKAEPRLITSQQHDHTKAPYLGYIYAIKEMMKTLPFVIVGYTIPEIEAKIRDICARSEDGTAFEGDLSRMDGRKGLASRILWGAMLDEKFEGEDKAKVQECHEHVIGMMTVSKTGVKVNTGFAQGSGMPDTTDHNSYENGLLMYSAKRLEGVSIPDAWHWLCTCVGVSGDDSFGVNLGADSYNAAVLQNGHKPKYKGVGREDPFCFLGRVYGPGPIYVKDEVNSIQNPERSLIKLVSTPHKFTTIKQRRRFLFEKFCASKTSDPNTPHTSIIADCVIRAGRAEYGWEFFRNVKELNYNVRSDGDDDSSYSNDVSGGWADELIRRIWQEVDFDSMDEYFSRDLTFDEIEEHPVFTNYKLRRELELTYLEKTSLDNEPAEVAQYGNVNKVELNTSSACADPKNGIVFKEAYRTTLQEFHLRFEYEEELKEEFLLNHATKGLGENRQGLEVLDLTTGNDHTRRKKRRTYRDRVRLDEPRNLGFGFDWMLLDRMESSGPATTFELEPPTHVLLRPTSSPVEEQSGDP